MMNAPVDRGTVARVAAVLGAIGARGDQAQVSVSEIAASVGRERSQISRMLKALAAVGFVEQDPESRAYRLGWQLHVLGVRAGDQRLVAVGMPVLRNVVNETGETALLSILQGNQSFTILRDSPRYTLQAGGWVGRASPLHVTASGRALILDRTNREVRGLILEDLGGTFGPLALRSEEEVFERLSAERTAGCCVAVDELEMGLTAVAAPILDASRRIIATVNVSGPTSRMEKRIDEVCLIVKVAARRFSGALARLSSGEDRVPGRGRKSDA